LRTDKFRPPYEVFRALPRAWRRRRSTSCLPWRTA